MKSVKIHKKSVKINKVLQIFTCTPSLLRDSEIDTHICQLTLSLSTYEIVGAIDPLKLTRYLVKINEVLQIFTCAP